MKKPYKGRKRVCFKGIPIWYRKRLYHFLQYKVGDWINTCEGWNRQIAAIEYDWIKISKNNWFLQDIIFTDSHGKYHYVSGPGCVEPKQSNEEICNYWLECWADIHNLNEEGTFSNKFTKYALFLKAKANQNIPIITENGEPLFTYKDAGIE